MFAPTPDPQFVHAGFTAQVFEARWNPTLANVIGSVAEQNSVHVFRYTEPFPL